MKLYETVWASRPLHELNGVTGFVVCDAELAARLIADDLVQDPRDGGTAMREIDNTPLAAPKRQAPQEYDDKALTNKRRTK